MQIKQSTALSLLWLSIFMLLLTNQTYADESPSVTIKRLTMESAMLVAQGAVKACRKEGIQVTATVVDRNGQVQAVARDTLAPHVSLAISRMKAYTAANFTADTSALTSRADTPIGRIDGMVMYAGGALISVGGVVYGAVGVSGAPSGKTDEKCAKAGVEAISEELEMAD